MRADRAHAEGSQGADPGLRPAGAEYSSVQVMEVMRSLVLSSRASHGKMADRVTALGLPHGDDHLLVLEAVIPATSSGVVCELISA
jgi:hypothetical protein